MQLNFTYNLQGGQTAFAAHVMGNFNHVAAVVNGQLGHDNFGELTGGLVWNIASAAQRALTITTAATVGALSIQQSAPLAVGEAALSVRSSAVQASGTALVRVALTSAASSVPAVQIESEGTGPALNIVSARSGAVNAPRLTLAERNNISAPVEGMEIWNTTHKRKEIYDGSHWVDAAGRTGQVVDFAGSILPPHLLECDGSAVSRTTYAALFARLGTTWGSGDGSTTFNLPDLRGRATIGAGQGTGLSNRTLGQALGAETHTLTTAQLPSHSHPGSFATATHKHNSPLSLNGPQDQFFLKNAYGYGTPPQPGGSGSFLANVTTGLGMTDPLLTSAPTEAAAVGFAGSGEAHNNMQPSAVMRKCIVI